MLHTNPGALFIASNSFLQVENQFLKWVLEWESRVFPTVWKGQHHYCFNILSCKQIDDCVKNYQIYRIDEVGQDRLAWTVFAKALLKENCKVKHGSRSRSLKRCLYVLIFISFYLQLSSCKLVQSVLREILLCNKNFKFIFSFLPGMSISYYISKYLDDRSSKFEDTFCKEFLFMVSENGNEDLQHSGAEIYRWAQPMICYQVKNLRPLHGDSISCSLVCRSQSNHEDPTLACLLDRKIHPYYRDNLLTLALQYNDIPLINTLLKLGASAAVKLWDPIREENVTPERMMISSINSIMASQQLLSSRLSNSDSVLDSIQKRRDQTTLYAKRLTRSLLQPESQKASNAWDGATWKIELNKEIAEEWGIGCSRPLPSLQHMAKICVRQQILAVDREILSFAIENLPIPYLLKRYLDLELD